MGAAVLMRLAPRATMVLVAIAAIACTAPEGRFTCVSASDCPASWVCRAEGLCWSTPAGGGLDGGDRLDAAGRDASGVDAPGLDAPGLDASDLDAPDLDAPGTDPLDARRIGDAGPSTCAPPHVLVTSPRGGGERCSQFGGLYIRSESAGLPCRVPNPFTGGCTCPVGLEARDMTSWRVTSSGTIDMTSRLWACEPPFPVNDASWGGIYVIDAGGTCAYPNRVGSTGFACGCRTGIDAVARWVGVNSVGTRMTLVFCRQSVPVGPNAIVETAFTQRVAAGACTAACLAGEPGCACPAGSTGASLTGVEDGTPSSCALTSTLCVPNF